MPPNVPDMDAVYAALFTTFGETQANAWWQWFTTDWRGWGREGWQRLDQARREPPCNHP